MSDLAKFLPILSLGGFLVSLASDAIFYLISGIDLTLIPLPASDIVLSGFRALPFFLFGTLVFEILLAWWRTRDHLVVLPIAATLVLLCLAWACTELFPTYTREDAMIDSSAVVALGLAGCVLVLGRVIALHDGDYTPFYRSLAYSAPTLAACLLLNSIFSGLFSSNLTLESASALLQSKDGSSFGLIRALDQGFFVVDSSGTKKFIASDQFHSITYK